MRKQAEKKLGMDGESWRTEFAEWSRPEELRVEAAEEISSPAGIHMDKVYLVGANIFYCTQGAFRFSLPEHKPIILKAGELLVIYARHFVTIEALDKKGANKLSFVIVAGDFANEYVAKLGFINHLRARCTFPRGSFTHLRDILANKDAGERDTKTEALSLLNSMLRSTWEEIRMNGDTPFYDAVRTILRDVLDGKARVKDVSEELHICRAQLHRIFIRNGFKSIGAFIKDTQFHYALKLLLVSDLNVSTISRKLGFSSPSNFTTFIRQRAGKSPMQIRGKTPSAASEKPRNRF